MEATLTHPGQITLCPARPRMLRPAPRKNATKALRLFAVVLSLLFGPLLAAPAWAQSCSDILQRGVFELTNQSRDRRSFELVARHACNFKKSSDSWSTSGGYGPWWGSGSSQNSRLKSACTSFDRQRAYSEQSHDIFIRASEAIVGAWSRCMDTDLLRFSLTQTGQPKFVRGTIKYRKRGVQGAAFAEGNVTMRFVEADSCECERSGDGSACKATGRDISFNIPDGGSQAFVCTRENTGPVEATMTSPIDDARDASVAALSLSPRLSLSGRTFGSNGHCKDRIRVIPNIRTILIAEDFPEPFIVALQYHGHSSNLGSVSLLAEDLPFTKANLSMVARRRNPQPEGIYASIGNSRVKILTQAGNYDCSDDLGYAKVTNFNVNLIRKSILD